MEYSQARKPVVDLNIITDDGVRIVRGEVATMSSNAVSIRLCDTIKSYSFADDCRLNDTIESVTMVTDPEEVAEYYHDVMMNRVDFKLKKLGQDVRDSLYILLESCPFDLEEVWDTLKEEVFKDEPIK